MLIALAVSYPGEESFYGLFQAADVEAAKELYAQDPLPTFQPDLEDDGHIVIETREALDAFVEENWENPFNGPVALTGWDENGQAQFIDPYTLV